MTFLKIDGTHLLTLTDVADGRIFACTEASDLGFRADGWPSSFVLEFKGRSYTLDFSHGSKNQDGELTHVVYAAGGLVLTVYND